GEMGVPRSRRRPNSWDWLDRAWQAAKICPLLPPTATTWGRRCRAVSGFGAAIVVRLDDGGHHPRGGKDRSIPFKSASSGRIFKVFPAAIGVSHHAAPGR